MPRFALAFIGFSLICSSLTGAEPTEAVITVPEVEVRSGPSVEFYVTGKLRQGDRVQVKSKEYGFLAIVPPAGSFSLVPKDVVKVQGANRGIILKRVETIIGSQLDNQASVSSKLVLNECAWVDILGESGVFYQIEPKEEVRYIPAEAIQKPAEIILTGGPPPPAAPGGPPLPPAAPPSPGPVGPLAARVQEAEQAYRNRDWATARRLYEELAKAPDASHELRMEAWNKIHFIQVQSGGYAASSNRAPAYQVSRSNPPAGYVAPPASVVHRPMAVPAAPILAPRVTSTYTYTTDSGPTRLVPVAQPSVVYSNPAPAAPAKFVPGNQGTTPATVTASLASSGPGRLRKARQIADGRTLYYLEDSRGDLRCYVAPVSGLNLEPFVDQNVEVQGGTMVYRSDLRRNYMTAIRVVPLGN